MFTTYISRFTDIYTTLYPFNYKLIVAMGHKLLALVLVNMKYPLRNPEVTRLPLHLYQDK